MKKICFICTGNACRSQMAEGLARQLGRERVQVYSAGSHPAGYILPKTITVMKEIGIDISGQKSKSLKDVPLKEMDVVITLCDSAASYCPTLPNGIQKLHWPLIDPTQIIGGEERVLGAFRRTRETLQEKLGEWLENNL